MQQRRAPVCTSSEETCLSNNLKQTNFTVSWWKCVCVCVCVCVCAVGLFGFCVHVNQKPQALSSLWISAQFPPPELQLHPAAPPKTCRGKPWSSSSDRRTWTHILQRLCVCVFVCLCTGGSHSANQTSYLKLNLRHIKTKTPAEFVWFFFRWG